MTDETPPVEDQVDEAYDGILDEAKDEIMEVVNDLRNTAARVKHGEADAEQSDLFFSTLDQVFSEWTELVINLFLERDEPSDSERALNLYSLIDISRALLDQPTMTEVALEQMKNEERNE